jgi:hypothetical protein
MKPLVQLAEAFASWKEELVRMWRFTKNNAVSGEPDALPPLRVKSPGG